jgi:hypothetical protein
MANGFKVDIKKATNLPVEQANFVFCQYSFFEKEQIVVPARQESSTTTNGHGMTTQQTVHFESPNVWNKIKKNYLD